MQCSCKVKNSFGNQQDSCSLKEGIFIGYSNTHVVGTCLIYQLSSISLCLLCKAVRRVLLGVRWGGGATSRGARMEFLIRGAPHSAPPAKAGKTKRPRPTLMGSWAGGAAGTHRAPFNQREISNISRILKKQTSQARGDIAGTKFRFRFLHFHNG